MRTELFNIVMELAEKYRNELREPQLYADYVYLALLKVVEDRDVLSEHSYDEEEYRKLKDAIKKEADGISSGEFRRMIEHKEYTKEDETAFRDFLRWLSFSTGGRDAATVFCKLHTQIKPSIQKEDAGQQKEDAGQRKEDAGQRKEDKEPEAKKAEIVGGGKTSPETKAPGQRAVSFSTLVREASQLRETLLERVYGQNQVVKEFTEGYFKSEMLAASSPDRKGPRASFLFLGTPGVGKTYLAETAAKALELPYKRFDMSGYSDSGEFELAGTPGAYKNCKQGLLTGFVKENPHCLVLFDEVEKATKDVLLLFLQVLDEGRLFDNYLEENISFNDVIIIMTTNAGRNLYQNTEIKNLSLTPKQLVISALQKDINEKTHQPYFPDALCSRFGAGNVLLFNHLNASQLIRIAERELEANKKNTEKTYAVAFENGTDITPSILYALGGHSDARQTVSRVRNFFHQELFELFRMMEEQKGFEAIDKLKKISWHVDFKGAKEEILDLYRNNRSGSILVYGDEELKLLEKMPDNVGEILTASTLEETQQILQKKDVIMAIVDYCHGMEEGQALLNTEDIKSEGRLVFDMIIKEYPDIAVYVMQTKKHLYGREETLSFTGRGAEDIILLPLKHENAREDMFLTLCQDVCYQRAMDMLTLRHQMLAYETRQEISEDGTQARITLYDLKLVQSVEAEDQKSLLTVDESSKKYWKDVVVSSDVKEELEYFVNFLRNPKAFMSKGARAPKGLLMYGPPGTGKTSLAKVVATEAGVTFLEVGADQFLSKWVGEGPQNVHKMFATARKYAPAILFIDEIDAIGKTRSESSSKGESTHEILNALLTEMDGFKRVANKPVFVMAATNLGGNNGNTRGLDPALVRRFDRSIIVDLPDRDGRKKILEMLRDKNEILQISDAEISNLATRSVGMSPANIESAVETAIRDAIRSDTVVDDPIMDEAFEKFNSGEEKKWDEAELKRTARHEAGHAFICNYYGEKPSYLTIVARDDHGGYMQHGDSEKKGSYTRDELLHRICTSLGGRAAEMVYYGETEGITTGASSDLENATGLARSMVCRYGMYPEMGLGTIDARGGETEQLVNECVKKILQEELEKAKTCILQNQAAVDRLVDALMDKMHLTEEQIQEALG